MAARANFSAETVAAARASGRTRFEEPVRNPDYLAKEFLGPRWRLIRAVPPLHAAAVRTWERKAPGMYHYMNARTHHIDAVVRDEARAGASQLVVLGSGYDTRAYRIPEVRDGQRVYEVDLEPTLERKREIVRRALGREPDHVAYIAADVGRDDPFDALERAGFDPSRPCCVVCEGLTYYLPGEGTAELFGAVARRTAPGSSIVFDYLYREALAGGDEFPGVARVIRYLERRGQPYSFGIPRGGLDEWLRPLGLETVSDLPPEEMQERYLRDAGGELVGSAFAAYGMGWARSRPHDQNGHHG